MKASSLLLIGILGIHVPWLDSGPGSPSRFFTEISTAAGDLSFRYGFYWFKRKTIIVTHKVLIIAFNMSMKYQLSYLMALAFMSSYCALLTGFVPRSFVGCSSCWFACFRGRIRALNLRCMNEASQMFVVAVNSKRMLMLPQEDSNLKKVVAIQLWTCLHVLVLLHLIDDVRSVRLDPAVRTVNQQWIPDDACMDKLITSAVVVKMQTMNLPVALWQPALLFPLLLLLAQPRLIDRQVIASVHWWHDENMKGERNEGKKKERKKEREWERKGGRNQLTALRM